MQTENTQVLEGKYGFEQDLGRPTEELEAGYHGSCSFADGGDIGPHIGGRLPLSWTEFRVPTRRWRIGCETLSSHEIYHIYKNH